MAKPPATAAGRARQALAWTGGAIAALLLTIMVAILLGATITANADWHPPARGIRIFVATNGVHTGIVVPVAHAGIDWRDIVRPEHLRDPRRTGDWLLIGWGERDFYLNTPEWRDVSPSRMIRALAGSDRTLIHVQHLVNPAVAPDMRPVTLTPEQYGRLARSIRTDFAVRPNGTIETLPGYGQTDAFYAAKGRYSGRVTCNEWTGARLRLAGVKVGVWTPLSWSVMRWF